MAKLWDDIRTKTLESAAPNLIHEEGALVKKAIRDVYTNDIDEVIVEGEDAYKQAKSQMKMLIPSHAKKVVNTEEQPHLFQSHGIEEALNSVYHNEVVLKSGGYLVINQTEALVAVDVNSGKATKERNIEETALKTNLEAAEEVGRQLKLRDLSGLIVIDFIELWKKIEINMPLNVILKMPCAMIGARVQVGNISHFGLLEMSRQRLRPSLVETVSQPCPHCEGTGRVRSTHSSALQMLRIVELEASSHKDRVMTITLNSDIAIYILNHKRAFLAEIEALHNITIVIEADRHLAALDYILNDKQKQAGQHNEAQQKSQNQNQRGQKQKHQKQDASADEAPRSVADGDDDDTKEDGGKKRRRGRRGGRRRKKRGGDQDQTNPSVEAQAQNEVSGDAQKPDTDVQPSGNDATSSETQEADRGEAKASSFTRPVKNKTLSLSKMKQILPIQLMLTSQHKRQSNLLAMM